MPKSSQSAGLALVPLPSRRVRKKERTRREIFAAAMRLFLARGFDGVTIDDICRAADVARGTFFLHFPTKDALLGEYGQEVTAALAARLGQHRGGAVAALRLALRFLAGRAVSHAEMVRLMVREAMARPVVLADTTEQSRDLVQLLAGVVRRGQLAGELRRRVDPVIAAAVVVSSYLAIVGEWARHAGKLRLRPALEQALDVVLHGLTVGGSR
jgi:AcrR family transcriptional regulator